MPGILPFAFVVAMCLGALVVVAVIFRYVVHRKPLTVVDLGFCLFGFALMFPGAVKSIDPKTMTINLDWIYLYGEPSKADITRDKIEDALARIETRLASCTSCRAATTEPTPTQPTQPPAARATGPRVVVLWEAPKVDDGHDVVSAIRAMPGKDYRVEGVGGDLGIVRGALPDERAIDIRLVSKPDKIADRDAIFAAIVAKNAAFKGRIERSTWPLANGDVQIQIFQR
jgi:hypothetical protein